MTCYTDVILLIYSAIIKIDTLDKNYLQYFQVLHTSQLFVFANGITILSILNLIWIVITHVENLECMNVVKII